MTRGVSALLRACIQRSRGSWFPNLSVVRRATEAGRDLKPNGAVGAETTRVRAGADKADYPPRPQGCRGREGGSPCHATTLSCMIAFKWGRSFFVELLPPAGPSGLSRNPVRGH